MVQQNLSELAITHRSLDTISTNPRNARTHSKRQIRQIVASIKAFGFTNPILVDNHSQIVAGHGRAAAAKLLGMDQVPTILLESLTQDQIRAYVIADNRLAERAGWDHSILAIELQYLIAIDETFDVTITGFEIPEIDLILQEACGKEDEDVVPDIDKTAQVITQPGDLWVLGKHRIQCGSSLVDSSLKTLMGTRRAHMAFVDPPYNVAIDGNVCGKGTIKHREFSMASGEMSEADFVAFLHTALRLLARYSTGGSVHYIFMDWRHVGELLAAGRQVYDTLLNLCVWVKDNGGMGSFDRSTVPATNWSLSSETARAHTAITFNSASSHQPH